MLVLLCAAPLLTSMLSSLLSLLLLLSLFPSSLLFCPHHHSLGYSVHLHGTYKPCKHTHTHSQYGCALPSTDARRITVREITVNICSINMMRLAERRRGEERIIYSVTSPCVTASLILFPPSLYTSLPISHSLSSSTSFFCFTIFPSLPLFIHVQSFSWSTKFPLLFCLSFTLISPLTPFPLLVSSLWIPSLMCLNQGFKFHIYPASSIILSTVSF